MTHIKCELLLLTGSVLLRKKKKKIKIQKNKENKIKMFLIILIMAIILTGIVLRQLYI